jgi:hypothetical protein
MLQQLVHVTPNDQQLLLHGILLENLFTLSECNVVMDSELHMEINLQIQIIVKTLDNRSLSMDVLAIDTVRTLKKKLVQHTRLAEYQQMLLFVSSVMQDDLTMRDCNVRNGDVILQMQDRESLPALDNPPGQLAQLHSLESQSSSAWSRSDDPQLAFPFRLRVCRVCGVRAYFQRGWCCNVSCSCKGGYSEAVLQQWLYRKPQQEHRSHCDTHQLSLPPDRLRPCASCHELTYLRKGWCCNTRCERKNAHW